MKVEEEDRRITPYQGEHVASELSPSHTRAPFYKQYAEIPLIPFLAPIPIKKLGANVKLDALAFAHAHTHPGAHPGGQCGLGGKL